MDTTRLEASPDGEGGCRLRLRVKPGSRQDALAGEHGGALKVSVVAAPEKGRANRAVERLLSKALGLPRSAVKILAGEASRDKVVGVQGLAPAELKRRLSRLPPA